MKWIEDTKKAIDYIESNLLEDIDAENVANHMFFAGDHFQKMFYMVTGFSVSEYIRNRRLSLAGQELLNSKNKVIDIALKYGYETPESFTKAFTRFHGINPSKVPYLKNNLKCFDALIIQINIMGGFRMSFEKLIENINYNGLSIEVVERPEFVWVGVVEYAQHGEPDIGKIIKTYHEVMVTPKNEPLNPDWTAAISIDYWREDGAPLGWMMAQETKTDEQDSCYGLYKVPSSLFMRVLNNETTAKIIGNEKKSADYELFGLLGNVMAENGYIRNKNGAQEFEYFGPNDVSYVYMPVIKT